MQTQLQNKTNQWLLACGTVIACLQIAAFLFGMPAFHSGYWFQIEPMIMAHFLLAAAGLMWLMVATHRNLVALQLSHPFWLVIGLFLLWQLLTVITSPSPWRAWFGAPNTGEGTGWWIALASQTLLMNSLWRQNLCRKIMLMCGLVSLTVQAGLLAYFYDFLDVAVRKDNAWQPNPWPDYMAFAVGFLWIALLVSHEAKSDRWLFISIAIGMWALLKSDNITGIALLTCAIAMSMVHRTAPWCRKLLRPSPSWRITACLACVIPVSWFFYSFYFTHHDPSAHGVETSFLAAKDEGVGSRLVMNQVAINMFMHEPQRLLYGHGFGMFSDDLLKYGLVDGLATFRGTRYEPNWFLLDGTSYHSHSQPLEAWLSFGIIGFALWLWLCFVIIKTLPRRTFWQSMPLFVGVTVLAYVWFEIPHVLGFHAMMLAAIISTHRAVETTSRASPVAHYLLCSIGTLVLLASAYGQWRMIHYSQIMTKHVFNASCDSLPQEFVNQDLARGGERLNEIGSAYISTLIKFSTKLDDRHVLCVERLKNSAMQSWDVPQAGGLIRQFSLRLHLALFSDLPLPLFERLNRQAIQSFETVAIRMTSYAPLRDDQLTIFLMNLDGLTQQSDARKFQFLDRILRETPNHRPAMWLMGGLLMQSPESKAAGIQLKKEAARQHVERVYPVNPAELSAISPLNSH
ncbi:MAG: O-antigen ligase family protein [Alphaproteobacteria bacterium]|nr:O-antigen ligase family protein [Alphaproteobacteria bacterium]